MRDCLYSLRSNPSSALALHSLSPERMSASFTISEHVRSAVIGAAFRQNCFFYSKINARRCGARRKAGLQHRLRFGIDEWSQSHAHASGHRQTMSSTRLQSTMVQHDHAHVLLPRQQGSLGGPLHDERRTYGSVLIASATSQRLRSLHAGASAIARPLCRLCDRRGGNSLPRRPLRSCPALCRPGRHAAGPLAAGESPIPA